MNRSHYLIGVARVLQICIALVSMRLMTHFLLGGDVGNIYLILSLTSYFSLVFLSPIGLYINRCLHKWHQNKTLLSNLFCFNLYIVLIALFALPVLYVFKRYFGVGKNLDVFSLCILASGYIYASAWNSTVIPALNMLNHRISFVIFSTATLLLSLCLSVFFVVYISSSAIMWIFGQILALSVFAIIASFYMMRKQNYGIDWNFLISNIKRPQLKNILKFVFPLVITTFFMWIQTQSYRIVVERIIGLDFLAMLALGLSIAASIASAAESVVQQIYYPMYYSEINTPDKGKRIAAWNRMASLMMPFYLLTTLFVSFLAPHIVNVLVSTKFKMAALFAFFGAWIEFSRITTNIFATVAHSEMRTAFLAKPYIYGGVVSLVGVFIAANLKFYTYLIPIVLVIGGSVTLVSMYRNMKRIMPFEIPKRSLLVSIMLSCPFPFALLIRNKDNSILVSIMILAVFGIYMVAGQYFLYIRRQNLAKTGVNNID